MVHNLHKPSGALMPAGVLCDMDGTLLDSEPMWFLAQREEFGEYGLDWQLADQNLMIGMTIVEGTQKVIDHYQFNADATELGHRIANRVLEMVKRDGVQWRPGAYELLQRLDVWGVPVALVTSSYAQYASRVADLAPGSGFAALITGDMVSHGKPDPEPYLKAAEILNVDPRACVAFEDSAFGVISAFEAGVVTVAVPYQADIPDIPEVIVLDSLELAGQEFFKDIAARF